MNELSIRELTLKRKILIVLKLQSYLLKTQRVSNGLSILN